MREVSGVLGASLVLAGVVGCGGGDAIDVGPGADAGAGGDTATPDVGADAAHDGGAEVDSGPAVPPVCTPTTTPTGFFVSPTGSAAGDGSEANPWDLKTALAHPASVTPGSTIWLRGGVYQGAFSAKLMGAPSQPIVVRSYPGEMATLDGAGSTDITLSMNGGHTWFWGIEVTNTSGDHTYGDRPNGLDVNGKYLKLINSYIHDGGGNFMYAQTTDPDWDSEEMELYGNLFYLQGVNGVDANDRAHGHAIYTQNFQGKKHILDNLIFNGFSWGIHAYAENPAKYQLVGIEFVGNVTFNTNSAADGPIVGGNDFLVGGDTVPAANIVVKENFSWAHGPSNSVKFGYGTTQNDNIEIRDNHFAGGFALGLWNTVTMTGNTIYGNSSGFDPAAYAGNTYVATPTGTGVFVRGNKYEPGRAHVIVYNWDGVDGVDVDLSAVLPSGAIYEIRNAQNAFSPAVAKGTYDGKPVHVPLSGLKPAQPVGRPNGISAEDETGKTFNVFLVLSACN